MSIRHRHGGVRVLGPLDGDRHALWRIGAIVCIHRRLGRRGANVRMHRAWCSVIGIGKC
jgi:hypothetical protein